MKIAIGKWRRLQRAAGQKGTFTILALDHRGPLRRALAEQAAGKSLDEVLSTFKRDVARELAPATTASLLEDPFMRSINPAANSPTRAIFSGFQTGARNQKPL